MAALHTWLSIQRRHRTNKIDYDYLHVFQCFAPFYFVIFLLALSLSPFRSVFMLAAEFSCTRIYVMHLAYVDGPGDGYSCG